MGLYLYATTAYNQLCVPFGNLKLMAPETAPCLLYCLLLCSFSLCSPLLLCSPLTRTSRDRWRFPLSLVLYITLYIKSGHHDVTFWLVRSHSEALASRGLKPTTSEDGSELENKDTLWSCDVELSVIRRVCHRSALVKRLAVWKHISGKLTGRKKGGKKSCTNKGSTAGLRGSSWNMESKAGLRLMWVHQEPPASEVFRKGAPTVAFLI